MKKTNLNLFLIGSILLFCVDHFCYADETEILTLLKAGEMDKLSLLQADVRGVEKMFLDGIFEEDGAVSVVIFQELYDNYRESLLAWEALDRIYQYHYALGYYDRASELESHLGNRPPVKLPGQDILFMPTDDTADKSNTNTSKSTPPKDMVFWVQCGAFSNDNNANLMAAKLRQRGYNVIILKKEPGVRNFYMVRVGEFSKKDDAIAEGSKIKQQLGIDNRIIAAEN